VAEAVQDLAEEAEFRVAAEAEQDLVAVEEGFREEIFGIRVLALRPLQALAAGSTLPEPV
jgi:hypothetical protein